MCDCLLCVKIFVCVCVCVCKCVQVCTRTWLVVGCAASLLKMLLTSTVEHLPRKYRQLLRWRMSQLTPIVVKLCIARAGFRATASKYIFTSHFVSCYLLLSYNIVTSTTVACNLWVCTICRMHCTIWPGLGLGFESALGFGLGLRLGLGSGLGQKFVNCAITISELHDAFCKLHKFTNHIGK